MYHYDTSNRGCVVHSKMQLQTAVSAVRNRQFIRRFGELKRQSLTVENMLYSVSSYMYDSQ